MSLSIRLSIRFLIYFFSFLRVVYALDYFSSRSLFLEMSIPRRAINESLS